MSTRSIIGLKNKDGSIQTIYTHFDGYPTGVGLQLFLNYRDLDTIKKLIKKGNRSSLTGVPTKDKSYGGTEFEQAVTYDSFDSLWNDRIKDSDIQYFYIYQFTDKGFEWVAYQVEYGSRTYEFVDGTMKVSGEKTYTKLGAIRAAVKYEAVA